MVRRLLVRFTRVGALVLVVGCTAAAPVQAKVSPSPGPSQAPTHTAAYGSPKALFRFQDPQIVESSGVATSLQSERIIFTHNDSGDRPRFFAVDDHGCTVARYKVTNARFSDWEDMAHSRDAQGHGVLWFGDIGDNAATRKTVSVYRTAEPTVVPTVVPGGSATCPTPAERVEVGVGYDLAYPDGPHDAEALMADPMTSQLYIVTKSTEEGSVPALYAAPLHLRTGVINHLRKITDVPLPERTSVPTVNPLGAIPLGIVPGKQLVTGADFAPDRSRVIIRTYSDAYEWVVRNGDVGAAMRGAPTNHIVLPGQPQGEAIGYTRDGLGFVITSEDTVKTHPPIYLLRRN